MQISSSSNAHRAMMSTSFKLPLYSLLDGPSAKMLLLSLDRSTSLLPILSLGILCGCETLMWKGAVSS